MFGMSCNFEELERKFAACANCLRIASRYVEAADFGTPLVFACRQCYSFSLSRLVKSGKYNAPIHARLPVDAPGHTLTTHPGTLDFAALVDAWHYALRKFVYEKQWTKKEVETYFTLLCLNKSTIDHFTNCCLNYRLVESMATTPEEYGADLLAATAANRFMHPSLYELPPTPEAWFIGTLDHLLRQLCICP
jgi:hypothetical protein